MSSPHKAHYPQEHTRQMVRRRLADGDLSAHTWQTGRYHGRTAMICADCGYIWKPDMDRPARDCPP